MAVEREICDMYEQSKHGENLGKWVVMTAARGKFWVQKYKREKGQFWIPATEKIDTSISGN